MLSDSSIRYQVSITEGDKGGGWGGGGVCGVNYSFQVLGNVHTLGK